MERSAVAALSLVALVAFAPAASAVSLLYYGGPVLRVPHVYLTFWGFTTPALDDPSGEAPYLTNFFNGLGGSAWANALTQYCAGSQCITNPTALLGGVWYDSATPPVAPDAQLAGEAVRAASHFGYSADGIYFIVTPHLRNTVGFGVQYCAWHSTTPDPLGHPVLYVNLPYNTDAPLGDCGQGYVNNPGTLDGVSITAGREYAEVVTDPYGDGWHDSSGQWVTGPCTGAYDIVLSTGTFAVPRLWSNAMSACV